MYVPSITNLEIVEPYAPDAFAVIFRLVKPATAIPQPATTAFALLSIEARQEDKDGFTSLGSVTVKLSDDVAPTCDVHALLLYVYKVTVIVADSAFGIWFAASSGIVYPVYVYNEVEPGWIASVV